MILEAVKGLLAKLARENKEEKLEPQTKNFRQKCECQSVRKRREDIY